MNYNKNWRKIAFLTFVFLFIEVRTLEHNSVDVDVVYVINLDRSPKRLKKMKEQLNKFDIRFKRLRASDGYNIKIVNKNTGKTEDNKQFHKNCDKSSVYLAQNGDVTMEYIPSKRNRSLCCGELGCALSHIRIWYDIVKCGYKCAVIFEDDVLFEDNFPQILKETLQNAPTDTDILFLDVGVGHSECATPYFVSPGVLLRSFERLHPDNEYVVRLRDRNNAFGTHAYTVTNTGAAKLIQNSKALRWPIDIHIMGLRNISQYVARKKMLCASKEKSEIHMMGRNESIVSNKIVNGGSKQ
ncbi:MAG: glycosyltransferase family 25 protein [Holosporaceae bacterium]|jgi:GR25 family glycosyltransferase involved in LPS biosynthesis|nr:glycosyltransferase family 25 protein [Holosporaceae bacterium]